MIVKKLIVVLIVVLAFSAQAFAADGYKDEETGLVFPAELAGFQYWGFHEYPMPGLGYSVRYNADDTVKVDIYVYDMNHKVIENGIASARVIDQFNTVLGNLSYYEKKGTYLNLKELERGNKKYGPKGMEFLWARYQFEQSPGEGVVYHGERLSDTYLTGWKGKFIKVRLTLKKDAFDQRKESIEAFMQGLAGILDKSTK